MGGALLATGGVTRLVEWYDHAWEQMVAMAATAGPGEPIGLVRKEERGRGTPGFAKRHDDAPAV